MKRIMATGVCGRALHGILGLAVVFGLGGLASADPMIDGRFDPGEGYSTGQSVIFGVEGTGQTVAGGQLWVHQSQASGDVSVLFIQPKTLVDNTYGDNSIGWGPAAPSGKRHNFKDLLGSDKAQFVFTDGSGNAVLDVTMDYISETDKHSGAYASLLSLIHI